MNSSLLCALASPRLSLHNLFLRTRATAPLSDPLHSETPALRDAEIACVYYGQRMAGDFYEFLRVSPSRVLFLLLDIAGRRDDTRHILIAAQNTFRPAAQALFSRQDFNEAEAMSELCGLLNRTILQAAGVRSCPAFLGCYQEDLGTVCYANAGHPPALLRDTDGITSLAATGLPLGLFTHAPHSAATCHLVPGAALLLVSQGVLDAENGREEFGLPGAEQALKGSTSHNARNLCVDVLHRVHQFMQSSPTHNDLTTLALVRHGG